MRDFASLLTDEENVLVPGNFNAIIEDIVIQARVSATKAAMDAAVTQLSALPIKDQALHILAMTDSIAMAQAKAVPISVSATLQ